MRLLFVCVAGACLLIGAIGCERVSAPYIMKMDRVDQKMDTGNRGYFVGTPPPAGDRSSLTRPFVAIDVDLIDKDKGAARLEAEVMPEPMAQAPAPKPVPVLKETVSAPAQQAPKIEEEEIK